MVGESSMTKLYPNFWNHENSRSDTVIIDGTGSERGFVVIVLTVV